MKVFKLKNSGDRGWFIGNFPKAVLKTNDFEVCYQELKPGHAVSHYHKKITEVTLIISGKVLTNGNVYTSGDIYILEPGEISQTQYLEKTQLVTVKTPSIPSDKILL